EARAQAVADALVEVILLQRVGGVEQQGAVDLAGDGRAGALEFELLGGGGALPERGEDAGDDLVDDLLLLVGVLAVGGQAAAGRAGGDAVGEHALGRARGGGLGGCGEVERGAHGGAGRGGRARWGGRRFGGDRFGHRGPVDLQDGRVHRSAVDAVEFVGGADQVPADAVRATRGGRDGEHDHLHAVDLGFLDGLGQ